MGFSYNQSLQHVAWRAKANAKAGRAYMDQTAERFVPVANDFREYVKQEIEKKKQLLKGV